MAFGGFAKYSVKFVPHCDPKGRSLKQSAVLVDNQGVGYYTDAGAFLATTKLPDDVLEAIRYAIEQRGGGKPNMVLPPDTDEIESLMGTLDDDDDT